MLLALGAAHDCYSFVVKRRAKDPDMTRPRSATVQVALLALLLVYVLSTVSSPPPRGADGAEGDVAAPDVDDAAERRGHGGAGMEHAHFLFLPLLLGVCCCARTVLRAPRGARAATALAFVPGGVVVVRAIDVYQGSLQVTEAHAGIPVAPPQAQTDDSGAAQQV